jgi:hypothetical protein
MSDNTSDALELLRAQLFYTGHSPGTRRALQSAFNEIERLRAALEEFAKPEMWARQVIDGTSVTIWTGEGYDPEDLAREALRPARREA